MADEPKDDKSTDTEFTAEDKAKLEEVVDKERKARRDADAKLKEAEKQLEQMQADADSSKSDLDKMRESIADLEQRAERAERDALVAKVAQAKKLPAALASRLQGDSQEELEADADSLIESLNLSDEDDPDPDDSPKGGRPKEDLKPGASSADTDDEITPEKGEEIAESIRKSEQF